MPVDIHRHFYTRVAELLLDVGEALTVLDEERREGVPEVMYPDVPQSSFCLEAV